MNWKEKIADLQRKLQDRYKLIVLDDDTLEEVTTIEATPLRFIASLFSILLILTILITFLISFTPLREYIPGYSDLYIGETAQLNATKIDSLYITLQQKDLYLSNIKNILQGKDSNNISESTPIQKSLPTSIKYTKSVEDSLLRKYVEEEDRFNVFENKTVRKSEYSFFAPLKGTVTSAFEPSKKHFGIDIVAPKNESVKAIMKGTVISSNWTDETGHVIILQHSNNLISVYKHNSVLLKKVGDVIKVGESIAIIGNSGEITTGPHLHFEIWSNGTPVNPTNYIVF